MSTPTDLGAGRDKAVVYLEFSQAGSKYYHPPKDGKRQFSVIWWMPKYHLGASWRAQVYYADPQQQREYWTARGYRVIERNEGS